mmetsp:Transcript_12855/g.16849  ORF Transcript_12855/g.16849 Transcript_12855/m.16849 type:complete len:186 (-) Transcript_12855:45-602(-)
MMNRLLISARRQAPRLLHSGKVPCASIHCRLDHPSLMPPFLNTRSFSTTFEWESTVYVHPLSQMILEYLQSQQNDWVLAHGLEGLTIHKDGSFELKFDLDNHGGDDKNDTSRIWTNYDEKESKHYLMVHYRGTLLERYLLQDNLASAWNDNRKSIPDRIQDSVDELIRAVDNTEKKRGDGKNARN